MMELIKRRIHMNRRGSGMTAQMTLDDDFIVPDAMDDVERLILERGDIRIEAVRNQGERVLVKGMLMFRVLYRTPEGHMMTLAGNIPFEETVNVPGLKETDEIRLTWELDDLNIEMINSRKISAKALITFHVQAERTEDVEAVTELKHGGDAETLMKTARIAVPAVRKKDTFRLKKNLEVPGNRPEIETLLWQDVELRDVHIRPLDDRILIEGELMVFLIYAGGESGMPVQCLEEIVPFSEEAALSGADEEMIPFIPVRIVHKEAEACPDADGEMREIRLDVVLEADISLYEEEEIEFLCDLYALDREVVPEMQEMCFERILTKNTMKTRIQEKIEIPGKYRILQICHSAGTVKVDDVEITDDGLLAEGVLEVVLLYMTADDRAPVSSHTELIPFRLPVEVPGIRPDCTFDLASMAEQVSAVMTGSDSVEIRASITLEALVMEPVCEPVICRVTEKPIDLEKLKQMPGIAGYVVQKGDTLWKIAREYHTSVDEIMEINRLENSEIRPGDRLILVKLRKL